MPGVELPFHGGGKQYYRRDISDIRPALHLAALFPSGETDAATPGAVCRFSRRDSKGKPEGITP